MADAVNRVIGHGSFDREMRKVYTKMLVLNSKNLGKQINHIEQLQERVKKQRGWLDEYKKDKGVLEKVASDERASKRNKRELEAKKKDLKMEMKKYTVVKGRGKRKKLKEELKSVDMKLKKVNGDMKEFKLKKGFIENFYQLKKHQTPEVYDMHDVLLADLQSAKDHLIRRGTGFRARESFHAGVIGLKSSKGTHKNLKEMNMMKSLRRYKPRRLKR